MSTLTLIPYKTHDAVEAKELVGHILKHYTQTAYPPTVESMLKTSIKYFRIFEGEQQVGLSGYDLKTPTLAETVKTIVFEEFRGKGYGGKLSQAIEDECKRIGVKKVMTTIYTFNVTMIHIKLKQGYVIEGHHLDHEAPGFHEYSLGKILSV